MPEKMREPFNEKNAFTLLCSQVELGPRYPGTLAHESLIELIKSELKLCSIEGKTQPFTVTLNGALTRCQNILCSVKGSLQEGNPPPKKILLGTHFDTRPIADRDSGELAKMPIPGANDGGSGTAVMLEIARTLTLNPPPGEVIFAFFDAEDVGCLDDNQFYRGSAFFAENMGEYVPGEVLILDMIGGEKMCLDVDLNCFIFDSYYNLGVKEMFMSLAEIAREQSCYQFYGKKRDKFKYIGCDHIPFLQAGIPAYILIDIDYPQWHTHEDLPAHCSPLSLKAVGEMVLEYIYNPGLGRKNRVVSKGILKEDE